MVLDVFVGFLRNKQVYRLRELLHDRIVQSCVPQVVLIVYFDALLYKYIAHIMVSFNSGHNEQIVALLVNDVLNLVLVPFKDILHQPRVFMLYRLLHAVNQHLYLALMHIFARFLNLLALNLTILKLYLHA